MPLPSPQPVSSQPSLTVLAGKLLRRHGQLNLALFDQAIVSGVNFLTGILLARFLGLEEFGRFTLVWMVVLLVNTVQQSLILFPMMSLGPKQDEADMPSYFGAVAWHQMGLCLACVVLTVLAGFAAMAVFPQWQVGSLILPLAVLMVCFQAQEWVRRYFFTRQRMMDALVNDGVSYGGQIILLLSLFAAMPLTSDAVLWIIAGTSGLAALLGIWRMERVTFEQAVIQRIAAKHWDFSRWLAAGSAMQWLGGQFFVMVSAAYFSAAAAGAIAAARNILGLTLVLFAALENFLTVRASVSYKNGGWPALKRYMIKVGVVGGVGNGLICLVAAAFAPFWMEKLFGPGFVEYSYLVYWFATTHFFMFFIRPMNAVLRTVEFTRPIAGASLLPLIFSLATSVPLVKMMGLTGAMIVMLGTQVLLLIYLVGAVLLWRKAQWREKEQQS